MRLKEPEPFTGDRLAYRTFKLQLQRYLAASPMSEEDEKISTIFSCIKGPLVDGWVNSYTERHFADESWDVTLDQVWADLDANYVDPNEAETALTKIGGLRQGNRPVQEYLAEFEQLAEVVTPIQSTQTD